MSHDIANVITFMFPEPTIKNIIPLFVIREIKNFYTTAACLYHFKKGIAL